jgi:hypothetical protein
MGFWPSLRTWRVGCFSPTWCCSRATWRLRTHGVPLGLSPQVSGRGECEGGERQGGVEEEWAETLAGATEATAPTKCIERRCIAGLSEALAGSHLGQAREGAAPTPAADIGNHMADQSRGGDSPPVPAASLTASLTTSHLSNHGADQLGGRTPPSPAASLGTDAADAHRLGVTPPASAASPTESLTTSHLSIHEADQQSGDTPLSPAADLNCHTSDRSCGKGTPPAPDASPTESLTGSHLTNHAADQPRQAGTPPAHASYLRLPTDSAAARSELERLLRAAEPIVLHGAARGWRPFGLWTLDHLSNREGGGAHVVEVTVVPSREDFEVQDDRILRPPKSTARLADLVRCLHRKVELQDRLTLYTRQVRPHSPGAPPPTKRYPLARRPHLPKSTLAGGSGAISEQEG